MTASRTRPYPFQREAVDFLHRSGGRGLLSLDPGLGKSFCSLLYAAENPDLRPVVVVCPAGLKWNWEHECVKHFGWRAEVLEGTRPKRTPLSSRPRVVIVNYDILIKRRGEHSGDGWLQHLIDLKPALVIVDESHYCQSRNSARTRSIQQLCKAADRVIALSGTPLINRPAELWPVLNILAPDRFASFWSFARDHCGAKRNRWGGWDYSGAARLPELHEKISPLSFRRRKGDVLADLPPKRRLVVPLAVADAKEYAKARDDFLGWLADRMPSRLHGAARAQYLVKAGELKRLAARLKLPAVFGWVDDFLAGGDDKLLLFAIHRSVVSQLRERYGNVCSVVDGSTTGDARKREVDRFLKSPKCRLMVGNIDAAGVGWSAKGVSSVAFAELPWSPGKLLQAEDRCHGIGRGVTGASTAAWYLVARDTVEVKLLELLERKQAVLDAVVDGRKVEELDLHDELVRSLRGAATS